MCYSISVNFKFTDNGLLLQMALIKTTSCIFIFYKDLAREVVQNNFVVLIENISFYH